MRTTRDLCVRVPSGAGLGAEEIVLTIVAGPIAQVVVERVADWVVNWAKAGAQSKRAHKVAVAVKLGQITVILEIATGDASEEITKRATAIRNDLIANVETPDAPQ
ncbi:MAG: hypothetical protein IT432_12160 [Phycisphaerales bacterium]|nr:hypothetical protein [Phycisphaerales bacterium]